VQPGAGKNKQAGPPRLRRRRFLQGAVLGAASAPLTPAFAAEVPESTGREEPQITGGQLVSLSQGGSLEVEDGAGRRIIQLSEATSIWKGGESLPTALRPATT
jgi:hypothetical protein